ncbi:MAG TPA: ABC transporter permease subunit [Lacibacter sp.]|nr:ABC transporter permease subunit [Lacibacter sp.]HMO88792.1 ABC transporter permease subunit [Lacibacter sp.]
MWALCKKEIRQYFSTLTGYLAIASFLLLNGLLLFVFSSYNILDYGYATLENFFTLAPFVLLVLIPAITMRLLPDEWKSGTMEILQTRPLTSRQLLTGKYLAAFLVVVLALLPTAVYAVSIAVLAEAGTVADTGGFTGSYTGLLLLSAAFTAISLCMSSYTTNAVAAFLLGAAGCLLLYLGPGAIASLPVFRSGADYYLQQAGMEQHYLSMARGVLDSRDLLFFASILFFFLFLTYRRIRTKS